MSTATLSPGPGLELEESYRGPDAENYMPSAGDLYPRTRFSEKVWKDAFDLFEGYMAGHRKDTRLFNEALSYDDFKAAAFDILDREVMGRYTDITPVWTQYVSRTTVRDFKRKRIADLTGGRAGLDKVPELSPYPERGRAKALYYLSVDKYGGRYSVSWEARINDDLGEISEFPDNLAIGARDTESRTAAGLLTDGNGANGSYFNATAWGRTYSQSGDSFSGGSSNLLAGNPALTIDNLALAIQAIKLRKDPDGRPIQVPKFKLVVPQALEITARRVLATREVHTTVGGEEFWEDNWVKGLVELVVEPWLDVLDLGSHQATSWWIVPAPDSARKTLYLGFLRGHETPDLRVKADQGNMLGGGSISEMEGSFEFDDIQWRVRHVLGTTGTDMIATAFSDGSGS